MKQMDIRKSQTVVVYDTARGFFASRAVFMLKAFGHPRVYLLDGGLTKWTAEGLPTEGNQSANFDDEFSYELSLENLYDYENVKLATESGYA